MYTFMDGKEGNAKTAECCFVLANDVDIIQVPEKEEIDILACKLELRVKTCHILATHNKHTTLGVNTGTPMAVTKRQLILVLKESTTRIINDTIGRCDTNEYDKAKELVLEIVTKCPIGFPYHKYKEGEERLTNKRKVFVIQLEEGHGPRLRVLMGEVEETGGLKNY